MKSKSILLILLCASFVSDETYAQNQEERIIKNLQTIDEGSSLASKRYSPPKEQAQASSSYKLRLDEFLNWRPDASGIMQISDRSTFAYLNDQISVVCDEIWTGSRWVKEHKFKYVLDANNRPLEEESIAWINNQMKPIGKTLSKYDTRGNEIEEINQNWNNNAWQNRVKVETKYGSRNEITEAMTFSWNAATMVWDTSARTTYSYDLNNYLTSTYTESWDGSKYSPSSRQTITNNASGKRVERIGEAYRNSNWENSSKFTWAYNTKGELLIYEQIRWNNAQWENVYRRDVKWDSQGNATEVLQRRWVNNAWENRAKTIEHFDHAILSSEILWLPWWDANAGFVNKPTFSIGFTTKGSGVWDEPDSSVYMYSVYVGLENLLEDDYTIFPNPVASRLKITSENGELFSLQLFDISGRVVLQRNDERDFAEVDVAALEKGAYILKINTKGGSISKKLMVE